MSTERLTRALMNESSGDAESDFDRGMRLLEEFAFDMAGRGVPNHVIEKFVWAAWQGTYQA